ncbi:hypothetical protein HN51_042965 [Arachis hypogaea]
MCGVLPKKMICFTASFECAASIHGLGSVAVNMVCCFILDGFLVAAQLLEVVCGVHYFVKRISNTEELIKKNGRPEIRVQCGENLSLVPLD